jgi:hypothetical protein
MKQASEGETLSQIVSWSLKAKRVTFRRHGEHGELLKPMFHRFEVKGGASALAALPVQMNNNPLYSALIKKGK